MALPVAPPANPFNNDRVNQYRSNLRQLVDNIASGAFLHGDLAASLKAFDNLVFEIETLHYPDGSDVPARFGGSPVSNTKYRVLNRPLDVNGPTILQHAVVSAFRDDSDFRNAGALEIINRLLDSPFVDPKKLSPANMNNMVQAIPEEDGVAASDVVAWIRSDFMDNLKFHLQRRWQALASRIETELVENNGAESPVENNGYESPVLL